MLNCEVLKSARASYEKIDCVNCKKTTLTFIHEDQDTYRLECRVCKSSAYLRIKWLDYDYHEYPEDYELVLISGTSPFFMDQTQETDILRVLQDCMAGTDPGS